MGWLVGLGLLVAVIVWFLKTRSGSRQSGTRRGQGAGKKSVQSTLSELRSSGDYWGLRLEVLDPTTACDAVAQYRNKQLLINHAPELPLEGCTSAVCQCRYVGLKERRMAVRRVGEDRREGVRFETDKVDRREGDRRKTRGWDKQHEV